MPTALTSSLRPMHDDGIARNQAEVDRLRGMSIARMAQLVNVAQLPQPILDRPLSPTG